MQCRRSKRVAKGRPNKRPLRLGDARCMGLGYVQEKTYRPARKLFYTKSSDGKKRSLGPNSTGCWWRRAIDQLPEQVDWYQDCWYPFIMQWASVVHGNTTRDKLLFVEAIPNEASSSNNRLSIHSSLPG